MADLLLVVVDCITPGFVADRRAYAEQMFPLDVAHLAGDHNDEPAEGCFKCEQRPGALVG